MREVSDNLVKEMGDLCIAYSKQKGISYTYKHKPLSHEEVFAVFGILPASIKRASKMSSVCLGSSLGGNFPKSDRSYLGYTVELKELPIPLSIAMLFIIDVLEAVIGGSPKGAVVVLDEFSYE